MGYNVLKQIRSKEFGSPAIKNVLIHLALYGDEAGQDIWPSQSTVAANASLHRNTVNKALKALEASGVLKRVGARRGRPGRGVIQYQIDLAALGRMPDAMPRRKECDDSAICGEANEVPPQSSVAKPNAHRANVQKHSPRAQTTKEDTNNTKRAASAQKRSCSNTERDEIAEAVRTYNKVASQRGWVIADRFRDYQRANLRSALERVGGSKGWSDLLQRAAESNFLCGRTPEKSFKCNLTYLIKPDQVTKLLDGGFDNERVPRGRSTQSLPDEDTYRLQRLVNDICAEYGIDEKDLRFCKNSGNAAKAREAYFDKAPKMKISR